jgi:hypothetical protein
MTAGLEMRRRGVPARPVTLLPPQRHGVVIALG